jgi:hypothetical protein
MAGSSQESQRIAKRITGYVNLGGKAAATPA